MAVLAPSRTSVGFGSSRSAASPWRHVDASLIAAVLAIAGLGVLMVYSSTRARLEADGIDPAFYLKRQSVFFAIGVFVMFVMTLKDYRIFRDSAQIIYLGTVGLLLGVLSPLGSVNKGQQASFEFGPLQLQPSEFAKVAIIISVAAYASTHRGELSLRSLGNVLLIAGVPMGLIYLQPDLGTALVFLAILLGMLMVAGAKGRHLLVLVGLGIVAVVAVIQLGVLKDYQRDRLGAFLDPTADTQRSAYNLNQSKVAIGSGGLTGKGLFQGTQTNLSYVPEQHTDFIFTALGEQLGLVGSATVLGLFGLVMWRIWRAAALARDLSGTLICVGVLAMLVFQLFENVGMTMGIMPITGIPLPFMSYGGSSMLATFAAIGLVLNVHMHRFS